MSIIQQIREKYAAVGFGFIALSLIAFILMDAGGRGGGGGVSPTDAVGTVNGTNISYEQFLDKTKQTEQMYQLNGRTVDENTRQQIYTETWRMMVETELMQQELDKLGLQVTDKEFNDLLFGKNPPEFLKGEFTNKETGVFDAIAAKQAIDQLKKAKNNPNREMVINFYLDPLLQNTLRKKYTTLLTNSNYVPKWMAEKTIADNGAVASLGYVNIPYSSIADSTVQITDAQIEAYVKAHANEFKVEDDSRSISYVSFSYQPSASDTADALETLMRLKPEFDSTDQPGQFVTLNNSALTFYDGYNSKDRIQIPQKDSIIGAGLGKVYGPYLDGNSYVLSRVVDVKTLPDSVKARHILIGTIDPATQQPKMSDEDARKKADSVNALINSGTPFELLALQLSDDEGSKIKGGDLGYFSSGMMVKEFNDFCFENSTGTKGVVKTQFGYHIIQITDQKNFAPAYKIAYMGVPIDPSQQTINDAQNKANMFYSVSKNLKAFDDAVTKEKYQKLLASDIKENDFQILGLGVDRALVRKIFEADPGDILEPEEISNQYVVVAVTGSEKKGLASAAKARPQVEGILRNKEKAKLLIAKIGTPASLEALATAQQAVVLRADSVSFASPMLPGTGYEEKVGGAAFNKALLNKVSPPIAGTAGVYVIKTDAVYAKSDPSANVEEMQKSIATQQRSSALYSSMAALRNAATIKDKRAKFL